MGLVLSRHLQDPPNEPAVDWEWDSQVLPKPTESTKTGRRNRRTPQGDAVQEGRELHPGGFEEILGGDLVESEPVSPRSYDCL